MSQSQTQHPQQHTPAGGVQASGQNRNNAEQLRQAVAHQPTLVGSVTALCAGLCGMIQECLVKPDPAGLQGLVDSMSTDLAGWVNAVLANTSAAVATAQDFTAVSPDIQKAFDTFAQQQAQQAERARAAADALQSGHKAA